MSSDRRPQASPLGQFDEVIDAIEAGTAYANVHSALYTAGEIRGQLRRG